MSRVIAGARARRSVRPDSRVSVVVIARDEEAHLLGCLRSLARQSHAALDVVVVDDGSRDATGAIADRVAASDARFRVVHQAPSGRSAAREAGLALADGELLRFVDGDDVLPAGAIRRQVGALRGSGSDLVAGSVHVLDGRGARPGTLQPHDRRASTAARTPELLRTGGLGHLLFTRASWDGLGLGFDARLDVHEDLPVAFGALLRAPAVDAVTTPVLLHRRHADDRARRRLEVGTLTDLLGAVDLTLAAVDADAGGAPRLALRALFGGELAACLRVYDLASPGWRSAFAAGVLPLLDRIPVRDLATRPAIERVGWELLRGGRDEALAAVLRAGRTGTAPAPVRRRGRRQVGWATLPGLRPAASRLLPQDPAVGARVTLDGLVSPAGTLALHGHGALVGTGAPSADARGAAAGPGAPSRPVHAKTTVGLRLVARADQRPRRLTPTPLQLATTDGGAPGTFAAGLDVAALRGGHSWSAATWDLWAEVSAGGLRRHVDRFALPAGAHGAAFLPAEDQVLVRMIARPDGRVSIGVETAWACVRRQRTALGGLLMLSGDLRLRHAEPALELRRRSDGHRRRQPLRVDRARLPHGFEATIPLHDLAEAPAPLGSVTADPADAQHVWELWILDGAHERRLALPGDVPVAAWFAGDRVVSLLPTPKGHAVLVEQDRAGVRVGAALGPASWAAVGLPAVGETDAS